MIRSLSRRLRRTLSFRGRSSKYRNKEKKSGGGSTSGSNWEQDGITIKQNGGISFTVKYLGSLEVSESRGTQVCSQAAHQMKVSSAGKKKQRVTLCVTEDTLRVTDDETKSLVVDQVIEKVSFCTPDPQDEKLFSYICRDGTSRRWLCHSFKGIKDSGERISHAVGCAFAACLAKKQQQNQQSQNFQRGNSTRKTLESRPNGVKLPQQSVDTLQKLNESAYAKRVDNANESLNVSLDQSVDESQQQNPAAINNKAAVANEFAPRPRPSGSGSDIGGLTRHTSLPYRTKKSAGSSTYQALTEDPLPPRLPNTPPAVSPTSDESFWLTNTNSGASSTIVTVTATKPNPFSSTPQPLLQQQQQPQQLIIQQQPLQQQQQPQQQQVFMQQQAGWTQTFPNQQPTPAEQSPNPFSNNANQNPFGERFV